MRNQLKPGIDIVYDLIAVDSIMHKGEFRDIMIDNIGKAIYLSSELPHDMAVRLRIRACRGESRIEVEYETTTPGNDPGKSHPGKTPPASSPPR